MEFSDYQTAIFDQVQNGSGNIMVMGVPGCGKTTTIVNAARRDRDWETTPLI